MNFIEQKNYDINSSDSKNFCIEEPCNHFISKYYILINQYITFLIENIYDNININNDKKYRYYIILKGLEMLENIMLITIMNTNNIDLAFYYCNKGYYYYIEFISQIDTDNNHLELNIKDAIIFVYKKTIFEIKDTIGVINNSNINNDNIEKLNTIKKIINIINCYIKIFKIKDIINLNIDNIAHKDNEIYIDKLFLKIINRLQNNYKNEIQFSFIINNLHNIFEILLKVFNKFNIVNSQDYSLDDIINFQQIINLIDKIFIKISTCYKILDLNNIFTYHDIMNLNNNKIKQILSKIQIE